MKLKPGITIEGLTPKVKAALPILETIFNRHDLELVITSTTDDSPPRPLPAHREGRAVDMRAHQVNPYLLPLIRRDLERALGGKWTVKAVIVYPDTQSTHIHAEISP